MERKVVSGIVLTLLLTSIITSVMSTLKAKGDESPTPLCNEALTPPDLPENTLGGSPPGYHETSEYLIGRVAVGIVFLESDGTIDPSTEDWTFARESLVIGKIIAAFEWLENQNPSANVVFKYDVHYGVPTSYEPINHEGPSDECLWIGEAMSYLGYPGPEHLTQVRDYVNAIRDTFGTDWGFAVFVVDSFNDPDGCFTGWIEPTRKWSAYAYLGGPHFVITYDNDGHGIDNMGFVVAHETCHIFYATDEYDGITDYSGYLNVSDDEGARCMMCWADKYMLCTNSREQLGWRDSDGDGIQDIVDTFPDTTLTTYPPDPDTNPIVTYVGSVKEIPYPNKNRFGTGKNVTINTIASVEFRVDDGSWISATPTDGAFDEDEENFTFTTPLRVGTHTITVRGINSVDNVETEYAFDIVNVEASVVGGKATPINKVAIMPVDELSLLAPYVGLTTLLAVAVATVVYVKKKKKA